MSTNAGVLASWQTPRRVTRSTLFPYTALFRSGQAAAYALARRLGSEGFVVEVQVPTQPEADWNDVHRLRRSRSEIPERSPGRSTGGAPDQEAHALEEQARRRCCRDLCWNCV